MNGFPTGFAGDLAGLLQEYTGWQIEYQDDPPAWVAVRRPTPTRMHVLVAHDLADLRSKLASAETSTPGHTLPSP
jgi:hypothetical protein